MKNILLIAILIITLIPDAYGTIQSPELLIIGIDTVSIQEYPLSEIQEEGFTLSLKDQVKNSDGDFTMCISSSCWRGYIGTWTVVNDSLFLSNLVPPCKLEDNSKNPFALEKLFIKNISSNGVFANWVSDTLNSKCIKANCGKFDSHFVITNGILEKKFETTNKNWVEPYPKNLKISKLNVDVENEITDSDKSISKKWYLFICGIILIIGALVYKRRQQ